MEALTVLGATVVLMLLCVGIHYEGFRLTAVGLANLRIIGRPRVGLVVLFALVAHLLEALVFAVGLELLIETGYGQIYGSSAGVGDTVYFSLVTYSSLGIGDLYATGPVRFLVGMEAITGLVLIAWTASFTYYEMQRFWRDEP